MILSKLLPGLLWLCAASLATAESLTGPRLLVVLENADLKASYSQFFGDLEARGYKIDFQSPKANDKLSLFVHGERIYDHAIFFPPTSAGYGPSLTPQKLVEFVNKSGNLILLTSPSSTPEGTRELARELDIDLPPRGFSAVDHFAYDVLSSPEAHDTILIPAPPRSSKVKNYFSAAGDAPEVIAFRGAGHVLGNRPLVFPVLSAARTGYTYDAGEDEMFAEDPWAAGEQMHYVTAVQARNNARVVVAGGVEMFSDEFFGREVQAPNGEKVVTANRVFAERITKWAFQEIGVVRVEAVRHFLANETGAVINPRVYRIKNDITFEIELSEWATDHWTPFTVPADDNLQLEFTMLDPYYRLNLTPTSTTPTATVFSTSFRAPDQHGIFSFRVNYKRPFVSYVDEKYTITLRHFAHDEYTRSFDISAAWPWICGIAVTILGWLWFCALWLYSAPTEGRRAVKKTQ